jgi:hypothetical protein
MKAIKFLLLLIICCGSVPAYSQEPKMKISLQYGPLNAGCIDVEDYLDYTSQLKSEWGRSASADVSYFITRRFFVTLHISEGTLHYSTTRKYHDANMHGSSTGVMSMGTVGLLAGYRLPLTPSVNLSGQVGFSQFNLLDEYYSNEYYSSDESNVIQYPIDNGYAPAFSASIPVKFSLGFMPFKKKDVGFAKNLELAYTFGLDIEPDFGFFSFIYHGPQLSLLF